MAWVLEPQVEVVYSFTDASGHRGTESYFMDSGETDPTSGGPAALGTAIQAITADAISSIACRIRAVEDDPGDPTDGPYARGADKVLLVFQADDGSEVNFEVGAPNETILDSDKINVDEGDVALTDFLTAMEDNACTAEGHELKYLKRGFRKRDSGRKHL